MKKTFQEIINTIKEGEVWVNKCKDRRLAKIEKHYGTVVFEFDNEYTNVGVNLNDIFVLERKKYTFEEAMKALKKGDIIESCYSKIKYTISPKGNQFVLYFDTACEDWQISIHMFSYQEIVGDWYINN